MQIKDIEPFRSIVMDILTRGDCEFSVVDIQKYLCYDMQSKREMYSRDTPQAKLRSSQALTMCLCNILYLDSVILYLREYYKLIGELDYLETKLGVVCD